MDHGKQSMAKTKPQRRAAQADLKDEMDKARRRVQAQQQSQQFARPASDTPDKQYTRTATERSVERERAEQRSVERVLLSAEDLWAMGICYSRVQLWKMVKAGLFPTPIKLSKARNAWVQQEVLDWVEARRAERVA
jgi:prophage regulatory protein